MACGNNMVSRAGLQSAPAALSLPPAPSLARVQADARAVEAAQRQVRSALTAAERQATSAQTGAAVAQAVKEAQKAVDSARRVKDVPAKVRADLVREAERQLTRLKEAAKQVDDAVDREQRQAWERAHFDRLSQMALGVTTPLAQPAPPSGPGPAPADTTSAITPEAWVDSYLRACGSSRDVREIEVGGFTYLYDTTTSPGRGEADNRVVAVYGKSGPSHGERDRARMAGFPNPNHVDRGHLVARLVGGGYDLNLVPQDPALNRGHSEPGKVWRELERYLAAKPGTAFFVRPTYDDTSDYPNQIEFGVQLSSGEWRVESFTNRPA